MTRSSATEPSQLSTKETAGLVLAVSTLAVLYVVYVAGMLGSRQRVDVVAMATAEEIAAAPIRTANAAPLLFPVRGVDPALQRDTFLEKRSGGRRKHEALDIMAPRGTPVVAVDDGRVARIKRSLLGGLSVYQYDSAERRVYFYAHLNAYAAGLEEGMRLKRGDLVGYVGSTGNAPEHAPHLHFTMYVLGEGEHRWWKGKAVDPLPLLEAE